MRNLISFDKLFEFIVRVCWYLMALYFLIKAHLCEICFIIAYRFLVFLSFRIGLMVNGSSGDYTDLEVMFSRLKITRPLKVR